MTRPGKSASHPLLSIDDTIERRLSVNIEFRYWVSEFGSNVSTFQNNLFTFRKRMIIAQEQEERIRQLMFKFKEPIERVKIKKYVGEFY